MCYVMCAVALAVVRVAVIRLMFEIALCDF